MRNPLVQMSHLLTIRKRWGSNVSRHDSDFKKATTTSVTLTPVSNMTATTHFGWPKRLTPRSTNTASATIRRMFTGIKFFEGELRLIADCLRCAGPQQVVKQ